MSNTTPRISAYIIAYNEAEKIRPAVQSVLWADEVVVADSHSTDGTAEIAASLGARVVQIPFTGFGELRNRAIEACSHEWIFSLDSDERCTPAVRDEILEILRSPGAADVYFVPRRNFFMGRWVRHGGYYPDYRQPQLFRRGALSYRNDPVHEGFHLHTEKRPRHLRNSVWQIPYRNLDQMLVKISRYSTLAAGKLEEDGRRPSMAKALLHGAWAFLGQYVLARGFLDGWAGFVLSLSHFEATFYKYAKLVERKGGWKEPESQPIPREPRSGAKPPRPPHKKS